VKRFAVIVEGSGEVDAIAALVAKAGKMFNCEAYVVGPPIRAGGALRLRCPGELERFLHMASTRENTDEIVVLVDLDDDCAANFYKEFADRAIDVERRFGKRSHICFCVREYETWFLQDIRGLSEALPEFGIDASAFTADPLSIRGAKEMLDKLCSRGYKQTRDQLTFTKKMNLIHLADKDRSFRKFVKSITGISYEDITVHCQASNR
jgi:hypothetical protein